MAAAAAAKRPGIDMPIPKPLHDSGVRDHILFYADLHSLINMRCCRAWKAVVDNFVVWIARTERERFRTTLSPEFHAKFDVAKGAAQGFLQFFCQEQDTPTSIRLRWKTEAVVTGRLFAESEGGEILVRANPTHIAVSHRASSRVSLFSLSLDSGIQTMDHNNVRQIALAKSGKDLAVVIPPRVTRGYLTENLERAFEAGPLVCEGNYTVCSSRDWAHPNQIVVLQVVSGLFGFRQWETFSLDCGKEVPPPIGSRSVNIIS